MPLILTFRQLQILELVAEGYSSKEIAEELSIKVKTVEVHRYNLMQVMDCKSSAHMVAEAFRQNLLIMERNTITTLGQLRVGDRFCYNQRIDVWQVMSHISSSRVAVNQIAGWNGKPIHKHDNFKSATTPVRFLRHTQPLPGEKCIIEDLKTGDVFFLPDDIITEYTIVESRPDIPYWLETAVDPNGVRREVEKNTIVTLVKRAQEVKV